MIRIMIGFVIPAARPPVIPGALIVLAMTLGYSSMDSGLARKNHSATAKQLGSGPTGLPINAQTGTEPHREHDHRHAAEISSHRGSGS
jgi:hypothetical protein